LSNWLDVFLLRVGPNIGCSCRLCVQDLMEELLLICLEELGLTSVTKKKYEKRHGYRRTPWQQSLGAWEHIFECVPIHAQTRVVSETCQRLADLDRFTDENSLRAIQMIIEELPVEREFLIDNLHGSWAGRFLSKIEMEAALRRAKQEVNKVVTQLNEKIFAATRQIRRSSKALAHRERVSKYRKLRFGKPIA